MPINWGMPGPKNNALAHFKMGMELGDKAAEAKERRDLRSALASYATNPEDTKALGTVFEHKPELGLKLYERADEKAFANALSGYVRGNPLATERPSLPVGAKPSLDGTPQTLDNRPVNSDGPLRINEVGRPDPKPDFAFLGDPQNDRDRAFLTMLERDPERALKISSTLRDNFVDRLKGEHDFYELALQELGRVGNDEGWQSALSRLAPYADALGVDLGESVPMNYPGPDGLQDLMEKALPIKDRLSHFVTIADKNADNARADRNTESLITTRDRRAGEYERHNRANEGNTRRGQDATDRRVRDRPRAAPRQSGARVNTTLPVVKTPDEARKLPKGTKFRTPDGRVMIAP